MLSWLRFIRHHYAPRLDATDEGSWSLEWERPPAEGWYMWEVEAASGHGTAALTFTRGEGEGAAERGAALDIAAGKVRKRLVWVARGERMSLTLTACVPPFATFRLAAVTAGFARSRIRRRLVWGVERGLLTPAQAIVIDGVGTPRDTSTARRWLAIYDRTYPSTSAAGGYRAWRTMTESEPPPMPVEGPTIDVVMPVRNTAPEILSAAIASVQAQGWARWRLLICDDGSDHDDTLQVLAGAAADGRIRIVHRAERGGIAAATAAAVAAGDAPWLAFLDHDDLLAATALGAIAAEAEAHPEAALIYTDEDKVVAGDDRHEPHFKPDFDPELLRGFNYIGHLVAVRRSAYDAVGGVSSALDGAQDHDFLLRLSEQVAPQRIRHLPAVCYHWRRSATSTADGVAAKPEAIAAGLRAVTQHLERIGAAATAETGTAPLTVRVRWRLPTPSPRVGVLVPTRDGRLLGTCLRGLLGRTDYPDLDVVVIDNGSQSPATASTLAEAARDPRLRVLRDERPFNFAALMNAGVAAISSPILLLLNDDVEVIDPGWLRELVSQAVRPEVGCVGAMLLYPDGSIQHAGIALGIGGVAGHPWRGQPAHHTGHLGRLTVARTVSAVTGACLAVRADVWRTVGGMDETHLPVAFNDVDFCLRVGERGLRTVWTPESVLVHHESQTRGPEDTPEKKQRFAAEIAYMRQRWGALLDADPYWSPHLSRVAEDASIAVPP